MADPKIRELAMTAEGRVEPDGSIVMPQHRYRFEHVEDDVTVVCREPLVAIYPKFLTPELCVAMMHHASVRFQKSLTGKGGADKDRSGARTSRSAFFSKGENEAVRMIEQRASEITGYPVENIEGLQVVHYYPGEEYKPHWDSYNDKYAAARRAKAAGYDRVCTILIYLNDVPCSGTTDRCKHGTNGHTMFNLLALSVPPKAGAAIFWESTDQHLRQYDAALHQVRTFK